MLLGQSMCDKTKSKLVYCPLYIGLISYKPKVAMHWCKLESYLWLMLLLYITNYCKCFNYLQSWKFISNGLTFRTMGLKDFRNLVRSSLQNNVPKIGMRRRTFILKNVCFPVHVTKNFILQEERFSLNLFHLYNEKVFSWDEFFAVNFLF
jgi:hypothetical protein